jgi:hypothetical protein
MGHGQSKTGTWGAARRQGVEWKQVEGAKHDTFWLGSVKVPIPRHAVRSTRYPPDWIWR